MEDAEFLQKLRKRIQESTGQDVELELQEKKDAFHLDLDVPTPKLLVGRDVLEFPGRARMVMQYTVLCLKEKRHVSQDEFLVYLQRN